VSRGTGVGISGPVAGLAALTAILLGLPVVVLVGRAVAGGAIGSAATTAVLDALRLSLTTTAISLIVTICLGTPLAFILARRRFRGVSVVETIVDLPIVLPPSVAGLALLLVFGRRGLLGEPLAAAGIEIAFTTIAVVIAQVFVAAPFFIRSARAGIASVDRDLEDAARVDGAGERAVARYVTLPLAAPALGAGLVMSWARALGEFGATIMFAGNLEGSTQTLPLSVYAEFHGGSLDRSIAAATILVVAAFGVLIAVRTLRWGRALDVRAAS
jgi:molybdate transport system permease protein